MARHDHLKYLMLPRYAMELVAPIQAAAERGEVNAQYAMGLIHAEGRGVTPDTVEAYYWLTLAIAQGDNDADTLRDIISQYMTREEQQAAEQLCQARMASTANA
jgi:TPR repeat protein